VTTTESHRLALALDAERAFFMWASGEPDRGRELTLATLVRRRESFGDDDPDTLTSRGNAAYQAARIGDHAIARDELLAVSDAQARVLGPDHPSTLTSRHNAAYEAGQLGDRATARDEVIAVSADRARVLGPDHPHTLISRRNAAYEAGALDDHALAREELLAVKEAEARVLGPDHPSTLTTRHGAACQAAALGDHATARTELAEIAAGRARVLGPEHPDTLDSRAGAAVELVDVGRPIEAIRELTAMIAESKSSPRSTTILFSFSRVLGRIRAPDEAEAALAALSSLGLEMTFEAVLGAVAVVPGDESELATWLGVWSQTTAGRDDLDRLSRLFDAAGKLLGGEPGPAHALPDEQRRVALMIAERGRTSPD
jgi:hypothetical protein